MTAASYRIYSGRSVSLRLPGKDDAVAFYAWRTELQARNLLAIEGATSYEEFSRLLTVALRETITLLACDETDETPVGFVQAYRIDYVGGWCYSTTFMDDAHRRRRIGLEASVALWDHLFGHYHLRKIYFDVDGFNAAWLENVPGSQIGLFAEEVRLREHSPFEGKLWDRVTYVVYRERWTQVRQLLAVLLGLEEPAVGQPLEGENGGRRETRTTHPTLGGQLTSRHARLVQEYFRFRREGNMDEIAGLLSDEVVYSSEATGAVMGREAVENLLRFGLRMRGGGTGATPPGRIAWRPPEEEGASIWIIGDSGAQTTKMEFAFDAGAKLARLSVLDSMSLMAAYFLGDYPPQ